MGFFFVQRSDGIEGPEQRYKGHPTEEQHNLATEIYTNATQGGLLTLIHQVHYIYPKLEKKLKHSEE